MADKATLEYSTQIEKGTSKANSGWSQIPYDLCALILHKLSPLNILRFKLVCSSWYNAMEYMTSTSSLSSSSTRFADAPWLLLPHDQDHHKYIGDDRGFRSFYSLERNKVYNLNNLFSHGICLGSSHGWLLFLNKKLQFVLLNPFLYGIQLPLPPLSTFPDILGINYYPSFFANRATDCCRINFNAPQWLHDTCAQETWDISSVKDLKQKMRVKAVLSSRPTCNNKDNNIGIMIIYALGKRWINQFQYNNLAFCKTAYPKWIKLTEHRWYIDLMSYHNRFYALRQDHSVEVWDFQNSFPIKTMEIQADSSAVPQRINLRSHIIKTEADLLLVVMTNSYSFSQTKIVLHVYKLVSSDGKSRWIKVESIGNYALALGLNQSILISPHDGLHCAEEDSIYFTNMIPSASPYIAVYNLRTKLFVKKIVRALPMGVEPPRFWVDPNTF